MMKSPAITLSHAFDLLSQGATLVTVNRRLARHLTSCYTKRQEEAGQVVWESPDILPYDVWLQRTYIQGVTASNMEGTSLLPILLTPAQELWVWENSIQESAFDMGLLHMDKTAKLAADAWKILVGWRLPVDEISRFASEDGIAFLSWMAAFQNQCAENTWLDNQRLGNMVAELFQNNRVINKKIMILAGFDAFSPQQQMLFASMTQSGAKIYGLEQAPRNQSRFRIACADAESEIITSALWAKQHLESDPFCRIGIIMPDLAKQREKIIRIFDDIFHPEHMILSKNPSRRVYNISLGQPLFLYPVIQDALAFLDLAFFSKTDFDLYSRLMRSPFWAGAQTEMTKRAVLDAKIREIGDLNISLKRFLETAQDVSQDEVSGAHGLSQLLDRMNRFRQSMEEMPKKQKPSQWTRMFSHLLAIVGWPGERSLNSDEYQTVAAWHEALGRFADMDILMGDVDAVTAYSMFCRRLDDILFQPETPDVPVQIMGLLEPVGETFDHLWITGLHSDAWPLPPHPHPFLPAFIQRQYEVPHASAQWEYQFARNILQKLLQSATHAVVSYPLSEGDTDLWPSPLITEIPEKKQQKIKFRASEEYWSYIQSCIEMEKIQDTAAPPIPPEQWINGGTGLLKAQASCPFSAFALYRLHATGLENPGPGLNAMERGRLVHEALECVWEILKSHQNLIRLDLPALEASVEAAVDQTLMAAAPKKPGTFTKRFTALERERLKNLLRGWLERDKERAPFHVVRREKKEACDLAGLKLHAIADRIDRLEDGRAVIVDYKTGDVSEKNWFSERLSDPQLPLYSVFIKEPVAGVLFGQVKKGAFKYLGIAEDDTIAAGVKGLAAARKVFPDCQSMTDVIDFWRKKLKSLASECQTGIASVSPASIHTTCRYCKIKPICRIYESVNLSLMGEASDGSEDL